MAGRVSILVSGLLAVCSCSGSNELGVTYPRLTSTVTSSVELGLGVQARETASGMARVELHVEPSEGLQDQIRWWLVNTGSVTFEYGLGETLHRYEDGRWRRVRNWAVVPAVGLMLPPNATSRPASLVVIDKDRDERPLDPGLYRVTKDLSIQRPPESSRAEIVFVRATFRILDEAP